MNIHIINFICIFKIAYNRVNGFIFITVNYFRNNVHDISILIIPKKLDV